MALVLDCVGTNDYGDRTKAWKLLQEKSCCVETPTRVSLIGQFVKLHPESRRTLGLLSSKTREAILETLFNALVINRLPVGHEIFVVQERFQLAKTLPELRTMLKNYDDSRKARFGARRMNMIT